MAEREKRYRVEVWDQDEYIEAFLRLPDAQQTRVSELMNDVLPYNPKIPIPGVLKRLKGRQNHLWQFDCGKSPRLLYEIDEVEMLVAIVYLGEHPSWKKGGRVGG